MSNQKRKPGISTFFMEGSTRLPMPFPEDVQAWKRQLANGILRSLLIVSILALSSGLYYAYSIGAVWLIPLYITLVVLLALIACLPKAPYILRASGPLVLIYALACLDLFESGRTGSARVILIALPVLTLLLFDLRAGVLVLGASLFTLAGFGWLYSTRQLSVLPAVASSANPAIWLSNSTLFFLTTILLMVSANYLINRLVKAMIKLEASVKETEGLLSLQQAVFNSTADGILAVDRAGKITTSNRKFAEMWNIPESAMAPRNDETDLASVLAELEDPEAFMARIKELHGRPQDESEDSLELKDGRVLERYSKPQRIGDEIVGRVWVFRDITEHKRAETELAHERDLLQALMDNLPDTIYFKDTASRFTRVNQAQARMLGIPTPDAAYGKTDFDFFPAGLCQMFFQEEQQLMQTGSPVLDRLEFNPTPEGQPRWLSASKVPIRDAAGCIVGLVGVTRDVTDRVLAQERADTTSHGLRTVIEIAHELIGCADLDMFCRRAVELARERLNIERCGLFLLDNDGIAHGTYGTDARRQTTDERGTQFPSADHSDFAVGREQLWTILESEHAYYEDGQRRVVGAGWLGSTLIRARERTIGVMHNDTAISHAPVNVAQQEVLAIYCSLLGSLIELKRTEAALRRTQFAVDQARDAIHWVDAEGRLIYVNDSICKALGYTREELLGMTVFDIAPDFPQATWRDHWQKVSAQRSFQLEGTHRAKNGCLFPVEVSINVMTFENQEIHCDYIRDITERKQAEEALRESRNLLQTVLDTIPVRVFWKDRDLRYMGCNQPFAHDAGVSSPEEIIGKDDYQMGWRDQADFYRSDDRKVLESGKPKLNYEEPQTTPDGRRSWLRTNKVPLQNADGAIWGVLGTYEDITERKQAEEALRESEEKYRRLVEVSPVAMWINQDGIITYMNPAALRILGAADLEQVVGRTALDFVHPDYHAIVQDRISQVVERELIVPLLQEKYVRLDGSVVDVEVTATPFTTAGGHALQVLFQDITERRRTEAERERLIAELESKNAELEQFTYTVSHDLKSPLVTIRGFLNFMERDVTSGNLDRFKADLRRIDAAADKMQQLLSDLLELSRIGRIMNPPEPVPFEAIVREALELVHGQIQGRGIQVLVAPDLPNVYGDRARLVEVVQNLVDNACKFMGEQPNPRVEIGQRETDAGGKPILFVHDNGLGIEPQYHHKVFGLFNKLDPHSEGTGVGLALVKRIVEFHGGRIWVESEGADKGTTFCFTLPSSQQPENHE